jgi:predicted nucleic acid-binding protein
MAKANPQRQAAAWTRSMMLVDSNLIIYAASKKYPALTDWFAENRPAVSVISVVETLGYHNLKSEEKSALETLFAELSILYPNPEIFQTAIALRQQRALSLGDALIVATAIYHDLSLATHNVKDFRWIEHLKLIDPLEQ